MKEGYAIKTAAFLMLSLTIVFVASQGTISSYMNKSWADTPIGVDNTLINYYVNIEDKSDNSLDISSNLGQESVGINQTGNDLTSQGSSQDNSEGNNQTSTESTGGSLNELDNSEGNNQTSTESTSGSESNQNVNQTVVNQQQIQNNQSINIQNNIEMKQKLEVAISEEEGEAPISQQEQNTIESSDRVIVTQHKAITGPDCRTGNVLAGASNEKDLRVLAECQDATGTVMHTKKMNDGDFKFFLKLDDKFKFLANEKNNDKTDGFLVVEIVPPDQGKSGIVTPKEGDHVHIWGAWVTDKPKGWHEIHPTWKVVNE